MKTLIVYHSRDGHTRKVATKIQEIFDADIEEIQELKSRSGIIGWISAGKDACLKKTTPIELVILDLKKYDLVIIGTPVWGFNMTSAVRSFLTSYAKDLPQVAFFATMGGSGDKNAFKDMAFLCGKQPISVATFIDKKIEQNKHQDVLNNFISTIKNCFVRDKN